MKNLLPLLTILVMLLAAPAVFAAEENVKCTEAGNPNYDFSCRVGEKSKKPGKSCGIGITTTYSKGNCICVARNDCKAITAAGANGGSMNINPNTLMGLLGAVSKVLEALKGGQPGGGSGGTGGTGSTGGNFGCSQYYQVSYPSSDPCAYYVPATGSSSINIDTGSTGGTGGTGGIGDIGGTGGTGSGNPISDLINIISGGSGGATSSNTGVGTGGSTGSSVSSTTASSSRGVGVSGEIRVLPNGATIVITSAPPGANSVVAGFLGTNATGGAQPTGLVASWCRTRPWASNFLSFIIPPTFFDNLCGLRGYKVGQESTGPGPAQIGSQVTLTQKKVPAKATTTSATTTFTTPPVPPSPPMTVDIWAVPPAVPLGARTTVFWTSKNAATCTETSPDGSFSHTTLSGGGATVPLSSATTFTISCIAPDGTHATDYVTVNLSI